MVGMRTAVHNTGKVVGQILRDFPNMLHACAQHDTGRMPLSPALSEYSMDSTIKSISGLKSADVLQMSLTFPASSRPPQRIALDLTRIADSTVDYARMLVEAVATKQQMRW